MPRKKTPTKYQVVAIYENGRVEVLKEAVSLHSLASSDINPGSFPITFVTKDDLREVYRRYGGRLPHAVKHTIDQMTDADMTTLADKMECDFVESLYWDSIIDNMDEHVERYHARVRRRSQGVKSP